MTVHQRAATVLTAVVIASKSDAMNAATESKTGWMNVVIGPTTDSTIAVTELMSVSTAHLIERTQRDMSAPRNDSIVVVIGPTEIWIGAEIESIATSTDAAIRSIDAWTARVSVLIGTSTDAPIVRLAEATKPRSDDQYGLAARRRPDVLPPWRPVFAFLNSLYANVY